MGQKPTEEELFQMISEVDDNMSGTIGERPRSSAGSAAFWNFANRLSRLLTASAGICAKT
jgi:hypothetical protein